MVTSRTRRIVNPGKRKVKRKLSVKQIKFFGTKRQRAALKTRRRNPAKKRSISVAGYFSRPSVKKYNSKTVKQHLATRKRKKRTKNIGEIVSISLAGLAANPGRKKRGSSVAKRRYRRTSTGKVVRRTNSGKRRRRSVTVTSRRRAGVRRRRTNPGVVIKRYSKRRYNVGRRQTHRRRNSGVSSLTGVFSSALSVIAGAIGSKYATQFALGGNNTGWMGYLGNAVASVALGWAAGKVTKRPEIARGVVVGGFVALSLRILQDMTPVGNYINLSLQGAGKGGDVGIGMIMDSSFPVPQTFAPGSMTQAIVPSATRSYVGSQMAQVNQIKQATAGAMGFAGRAARGARRVI